MQKIVMFGLLSLASCGDRAEERPAPFHAKDKVPSPETSDQAMQTDIGMTPVDMAMDAIPQDPNPSSVPDPTPSEKPEELPAGWSLRSPAPASISSDTTPILSANALRESGKVRIFADSSCKTLVAEGSVGENKALTLSGIRFKGDKSEDGVKSFYAMFDATKTCDDLNLSYTLKTDAAVAKTRLYRATLRDDPSTTISIVFAAQGSDSKKIRIHYDSDDHGRDLAAYAQSKVIDEVRPFLGMNNAVARLSQLKANTVYTFVIQDESGISQPLSFRTAPADASQPLSFIMGGDSRNNRTPRRNANLMVSKLRPHAIFFGGDMTASGTDKEWAEWLEDWQVSISSDGRLFPLVVARGNHEASNEMIEKLFDTPASVYYAVTFGKNLFRGFTLNSESSIAGNQSEWLKKELAASKDMIWKFAQYHQPMRPHARDKVEGTMQYNNWAQAFYDNRVQLVMESDSHTVKSTWPVKPSVDKGNVEGFVRDDMKGTVYIGEGGWGAPLRTADDAKVWTRASGSFNHFNWTFVSKDKMEVRTVKVDNAEKVSTLSDQTMFEMPEKIDLWTPVTGAVVTINPHGG